MRILTTCFLLAFSILPLLGILGCSKGMVVNVHPLDARQYPAHPEGFVIDEWEIPPSQSFVKLAEIVGKGAPEADDEILAQVLNEARKLGADGVIVENVDILQKFDQPRKIPNQTPLMVSSMTSTGGSYDVSALGSGKFGQNAPEGFTESYFISVTAIKYLP